MTALDIRGIVSMLKSVGKGLGLVACYLLLFSAGAELFAPAISGTETNPGAPWHTAVSLLGMAVIDVGLLWWLIRRSRLHGLKLMLFTSAFFYFVKTFTSMLEAAYFMRNVTPQMLPGLFAMTLPLCAGLPPIGVWLLGRMHATGHDPTPEQIPWATNRRGFWLRAALLSAIVYPVLFFSFGWLVAWRSPELRAFYGDNGTAGVIEHLVRSFAAAPLLYPFEVFRGALWVGAAWFFLSTTIGPWGTRTLVVAACFALIQNDVHFLPNPLMSPTIRLYHFIETTTSNALFALAIGWLLCRPRPDRDVGGSARRPQLRSSRSS